MYKPIKCTYQVWLNYNNNYKVIASCKIFWMEGIFNNLYMILANNLWRIVSTNNYTVKFTLTVNRLFCFLYARACRDWNCDLPCHNCSLGGTVFLSRPVMFIDPSYIAKNTMTWYGTMGGLNAYMIRYMSGKVGVLYEHFALDGILASYKYGRTSIIQTLIFWTFSYLKCFFIHSWIYLHADM